MPNNAITHAFIACTLSALSAFPICPTFTPAQAAEKKEAIRLEQMHYLLGSTVLTAGNSGVRLDSTGNMHFRLVAAAPDWTVHIYRDDDKIIKSMSIEQFDSAGLMPQFVQTSRAKFIPTSAKPYEFKFFGFDARRIVNIYQTQEYLPIQGLVAPQVERIVFAAYRLPSNGGLLLKYIGTAANHDYIAGLDQRGRKEVCLTTSKATRLTVDDKFYMAPGHYKQARILQEVVVGKQGKDRGNAFQYMLDGRGAPQSK
jgi:hypothetical protein